MTLQPRAYVPSSVELDLLKTLGQRVRMLTFDQVARGWYGNVARDAQQALSHLEHHGYLTRAHLPAAPELDLSAPVLAWEPGDTRPSYTELGRVIAERWNGAQLQRTAVYVASQRTANHFLGAGGAVKLPRQATHDIHVATVYLLYRKRDPIAARQWVFEEILALERPHGQKVPDAVLRERGVILRVIEFAGKYDHRRLRKFHTYCQRERLPYELW